MKRFLTLLPLAACGPHIDPCPLPCNPLIERCTCHAEHSHTDFPMVYAYLPDLGNGGKGHDSRSYDYNGDVSGDSSDENGGDSYE